MQDQFASDISGSDVKTICETIFKSVSLNYDEVSSYYYVSNFGWFVVFYFYGDDGECGVVL